MPNLKLTSMKLSPSDSKKKEAALMEPEPPKYPYGLTVELGEDSIEKIGMKELPKVGEKMSLVARVEVTNTGAHDSARGGKRRNLSLQITDLALGADESGSKPAAQDALYGKSKGTEKA